jgi:hypothetical protein
MPILLDDAVPQMCDARGIDQALRFQFNRCTALIVEQAGTAAEQYAAAFWVA